MKYLKIVVTVVFVVVAATFLSSPATYMQSFLNGVTVWAYNVLPALFPFAVLSTLAVKFFPSGKRSLCKKLFGIRADSLYVVSVLCGYPIGAKSIAESSLDSQSATRACAFCSSANPIFVVATVGTKLLNNTTATLILTFSHLLSTIINGLFYRKDSKAEFRLPNAFSCGDIGATVTSSVLSVLSVGGLIALFYMLTDIFKSFLPTVLQDSVAINFLFGLLEMTNGIVAVCKNCNLFVATVLSSFLLSFGGMCVFAQSMAYLSAKNVKALRFLQMKFTQGSVATILSFVLGKLLL